VNFIFQRNVCFHLSYNIHNSEQDPIRSTQFDWLQCHGVYRIRIIFFANFEMIDLMRNAPSKIFPSVTNRVERSLRFFIVISVELVSKSNLLSSQLDQRKQNKLIIYYYWMKGREFTFYFTPSQLKVNFYTLCKKENCITDDKSHDTYFRNLFFMCLCC
jgi:hypothetical protein